MLCRLQFLEDSDPFSCAAFPEPRRAPTQSVLEAEPLANQLPNMHRLLGAPLPVSRRVAPERVQSAATPHLPVGFWAGGASTCSRGRLGVARAALGVGSRAGAREQCGRAGISQRWQPTESARGAWLAGCRLSAGSRPRLLRCWGSLVSSPLDAAAPGSRIDCTASRGKRGTFGLSAPGCVSLTGSPCKAGPGTREVSQLPLRLRALSGRKQLAC